MFVVLSREYFSFLDGISPCEWKNSDSKRSLYCTTSRSDNFQLLHSWFVTHRKKLEEVDFVDEEFLHTKINKNGVYMWIMVARKDIPEDACSLGSLSQTL